MGLWPICLVTWVQTIRDCFRCNFFFFLDVIYYRLWKGTSVGTLVQLIKWSLSNNMAAKMRSYRKLLLLLSLFSRVWLCRQQPTRLPRPWDSPGKNTGVGCHFLLQCMKVKSQSEVTQSCLTFSDPMDCSLPGSSIHGIFQARVLEWGAIALLS